MLSGAVVVVVVVAEFVLYSSRDTRVAVYTYLHCMAKTSVFGARVPQSMITINNYNHGDDNDDDRGSS